MAHTADLSERSPYELLYTKRLEAHPCQFGQAIKKDQCRLARVKFLLHSLESRPECPSSLVIEECR
jgi:hypothetical protein